MMNIIKSHDLYPNLFHIEQRRNSLAGLLTQILLQGYLKVLIKIGLEYISHSKISEKYHRCSI